MKIKFINEIEIFSSRFDVVWDETSDGGKFSWSECTITIGIKSVQKDPNYTLSVISHELMEMILESMGARFFNGRLGENFLFNFGHQTFENAIQVHMQAFSKFVK